MVLDSIIYSVIIHFSHFRLFLHYPYPSIDKLYIPQEMTTYNLKKYTLLVASEWLLRVYLLMEPLKILPMRR
ncbi:hypothetical protein Hanom_Chr12g01096161 [Helianthus anomalus]